MRNFIVFLCLFGFGSAEAFGQGCSSCSNFGFVQSYPTYNYYSAPVYYFPSQVSCPCGSICNCYPACNCIVPTVHYFQSYPVMDTFNYPIYGSMTNPVIIPSKIADCPQCVQRYLQGKK